MNSWPGLGFTDEAPVLESKSQHKTGTEEWGKIPVLARYSIWGWEEVFLWKWWRQEQIRGPCGVKEWPAKDTGWATSVLHPDQWAKAVDLCSDGVGVVGGLGVDCLLGAQGGNIMAREQTPGYEEQKGRQWMEAELKGLQAQNWTCFLQHGIIGSFTQGCSVLPGQTISPLWVPHEFPTRCVS